MKRCCATGMIRAMFTACYAWVTLLPAAVLSAPLQPAEAAGPAEYSFAFLGDLHFDRLEHHDMGWVREVHPNDVRQIENYSRITEEHSGALLKAVSETLKQGRMPAFAVVQAGDFVEGLCGSYELQVQQNKEAVAFAAEACSPLPFLITKGNHDITGPGAEQAYSDVILPWLSRQTGAVIDHASYMLRRNGDLFVFFDGYNPDLDWLEEALNQRPIRHLFFIVHEPVVPFNARSQWHLFARDKTPERRERLLHLLGRHKAIVLSGHLHRYAAIRRRTVSGSFVQLSMNSVLDLQPGAVELVAGTDRYGPDLVFREPAFSPETQPERMAILQQEKPHVEFFELAGMSGWSRMTVGQNTIRVDVYERCAAHAWRSLIINTETLDMVPVTGQDKQSADALQAPGTVW